MAKTSTQIAALKAAINDHNSGRLEAAESAYQRILEAEPDNATAMHFLGLLLHKGGQTDRALELLKRSVHLDSKNATFHNNLGGVQRLVGQLNEARDSFERAITWQPQLAQAHYNLGLVFESQSKPDEALASFRRALVYQPRYADALHQIGLLLIQKGETLEAAKTLEKAIAIDPGHARAVELLVAAYEKLSVYELALPHLQKLAGEPGPQQRDWLNRLGSCLSGLQKNERAIETFERLLELDPTYFPAWINYSNALEQQSRREDAIAAIKKAIELSPDSKVARFNLGALMGTPDASAPAEFVSRLFDDYAERFDYHLVKMLKYSTPQRLFEIVSENRPGMCFDIIDLGCGTGLSGEAFKTATKSLIGVDLSSGMLDKAKTRGIYQELLCGDVVAALKSRPQSFDLVLSADVFVYIGDLADVFAEAIKSLRPGGLFAFSVEALDEEEDFVLRRSRRYAHSQSYLRRLAADVGFIEIETRRTVIREENAKPIEGYIVLLQKPT